MDNFLQTQPTSLPWAARVAVGVLGEVMVAKTFRNGGWAVHPHGFVGPNSRPPHSIHTAVGLIAAGDMTVWAPPSQRGGPVSVEVKRKQKLNCYDGWGFKLDKFKELVIHDVYAGPVLLVIVDAATNEQWCALVDDLQKQKPQLTNNREWVILCPSYFISLTEFIEQQTKDVIQ
jgi:hypothetical protein